MTTIDREAVIAKARKVSQAVYLATDKGVADDIRDTIESLLALVPEPAEDEREELESIVQAEDERRDGARSSVRFSTRVADALLAAGFTRRPLLTEEKVSAWVRENFAVSNGTQVWAEYMGSVEELTNIALALLTKGQD